MNQANQNLLTFILDVYPTRGQTCSTSWTNGSLCSTPEEELLHACFVAQTGETCPDVDYYEAVPRLLMDIAIEAGIRPNDDWENEHLVALDLVINFLRDFMADSFFCHIRDY